MRKYRSVVDLKGYEDKTKIIGESLCEKSEYQPLTVLLARMTRNQVTEQKLGYYEFDESKKDKLSILEDDSATGISNISNLDLVDASSIIKKANESVERLNKIRSEYKTKSTEGSEVSSQTEGDSQK